MLIRLVERIEELGYGDNMKVVGSIYWLILIIGIITLIGNNDNLFGEIVVGGSLVMYVVGFIEIILSFVIRLFVTLFFNGESVENEQDKKKEDRISLSTIVVEVIIIIFMLTLHFNAKCNIKGNISFTGERIYHTKDCKSYNETTINRNYGEQYFCSEKSARVAGFRKAENCGYYNTSSDNYEYNYHDYDY